MLILFGTVATTVASLAKASEASLHDLDLRMYFGHRWWVVVVELVCVVIERAIV